MAEIKRVDLGNPKRVYERKLHKQDVHQMTGRWNMSTDGEGSNIDYGWCVVLSAYKKLQ